MSHRRTIRILVTLFTTVMVAVQTFSMGLAIRCEATESASESSTSSCCHASGDATCSKSGVCCCGRSPADRCAVACACGGNEPVPATPHESDSGSKVQQLLASMNCYSAQEGLLRVVEQPLEFAAEQAPATKAGVNALLCVWLT